MSKSRTERKTPAQAQPPPAPVSNDVVPGRFTESDWNHLIEEESAEDFVTDILFDVVTSALDTIYDKLIERRVIPYSVNAAKDLMLDVIEWQFLINDPGEIGVNEDKTWLEDEEPPSGVTDSWAQGLVPVIDAMENLSTDVEDKDNANVEENKQEDLVGSEAAENTPVLQNEADVSIKGSPEIKDETAESSVNNVPKVEEKGQGQKSLKDAKPTEKQFRPYRGRVPSFKSISMTPVTDERPKPGQYQQNETLNGNENGFFVSTESMMKAHYGRPPGPRDVTYDHKGNVLHVQKLNSDRLPSHRVKTRFTVVDPLEEAFQAKLANKKQRYNLLRNESKPIQKEDKWGSSENLSRKEKDPKLISPLPPPLVDTIDVSSGVVIKEKGVIKRGLRQPLNQYYSNDASQLQPLGSTHSGASFKDILSEVNPLVKPFKASRPLPAIPSRGDF